MDTRDIKTYGDLVKAVLALAVKETLVVHVNDAFGLAFNILLAVSSKGAGLYSTQAIDAGTVQKSFGKNVLLDCC